MLNHNDKMYMDKDLIEDKLYELIDQFNERKINHRNFYFALHDNIHVCLFQLELIISTCKKR